MLKATEFKMKAKSHSKNYATIRKSAIFAKSSSLMLGLVLGAYCELVVAGPTGGEVIDGNADIGSAGSTTTINQYSQRVLLE